MRGGRSGWTGRLESRLSGRGGEQRRERSGGRVQIERPPLTMGNVAPGTVDRRGRIRTTAPWRHVTAPFVIRPAKNPLRQCRERKALQRACRHAADLLMRQSGADLAAAIGTQSQNQKMCWKRAVKCPGIAVKYHSEISRKELGREKPLLPLDPLEGLVQPVDFFRRVVDRQ